MRLVKSRDSKALIDMEDGKVLVTGASSFIGIHVVNLLVQKGYEVIAISRSGDPKLDACQKKFKNLHQFHMSLTDPIAFNFLPKTINTIVHIAGISDWNKPSLDDMLGVNIMGTKNIQEYGIKAGAKKIIYTSSISIYGRVEGNVVDDKTVINKPSIYGASKLIGERLLESTSEMLPALSIRLPGVLGLGAHGAWLSTVVEKLINNTSVVAYGRFNPFNNALHVSDLAKFIHDLVCLKEWKGFFSFPIAALNAISIEDIILGLKKTLNSDSEVIFSNNVREYFTISSELAISQFDYQPSLIESIINRYIADVCFE